jgi:hypothetical protein
MLGRCFRGKGTVSLKLAFVVQVQFGWIADILVWGEVRGALDWDRSDWSRERDEIAATISMWMDGYCGVRRVLRASGCNKQ